MGGKRRYERRCGFPIADAAREQRDHIIALLRLGTNDLATALAIADTVQERLRRRQVLPTVEELRRRVSTGAALNASVTVEAYLRMWIANRRRIKENTRTSYGSHIRVHLIPHLGHYLLDTLQPEHLMAMFDSITEHSDYVRRVRANGTPEQKAAVRGQRATAPATMHRINSTLRKALNDAIRVYRLITVNVATLIELPSAAPAKPLEWTAERVRAWQQTRTLPGPVMTWTARHTGRFLDAAREDPLYELFVLLAYRGLRRGEACGLRWIDIDDTAQTATISQQIIQNGSTIIIDTPKSRAGARVIPLGPAAHTALRRRHHIQQRQRTTRNEWTDTGLVFTQPDGTALSPAKVSIRFHEITNAAELPPIRLHGLRHGVATRNREARVDTRQIQELLGHATYAFTEDCYGTTIPDLAIQAAELMAAQVPHYIQPTPTDSDPEESVALSVTTAPALSPVQRR